MPFIGNKPSAVPLTSADIADSIITSAKIVDATIANADIANSTINLTTKVTGTLPVANGGTGLTALGTASQVLRTNSGATALEFATLSVAGTIVSSTMATDSTQRTTTSTSFVTASNTLSVTVTPSSSSNKFLLIGSIAGTSYTNENAVTIYRGSTNLGNATYGFFNFITESQNSAAYPVVYLDSPSTTSSITYQIYIKTVAGGGGTAYLQWDANGRSKTSTFTVLEIKG